MAISGWQIAVGALGAVFLYSGITNQKFTTAIQSIVQGQKPQPGPPENFSSAIGIGSPSGSNTAVAPAGPGMTANAVAILKSLGAPVNAVNIKSIVEWQVHEGANDYNNPLNTTQVTKGSVGTFNSVGVQEYATPQDGIAATIETLLNGNYNSIVAALRSGQGLFASNSSIASELSTWSGGGYSGL